MTTNREHDQDFEDVIVLMRSIIDKDFDDSEAIRIGEETIQKISSEKALKGKGKAVSTASK